MDNVIVPSIGGIGMYIAQTGGTITENVTALSILAMVIWYFLYKFDKKLDLIIARTDKIESSLDSKQDKYGDVDNE